MSNAPGGIRKGAGRKATPIDLTELEILCALHCTDGEMADRFGVSVRTIHNRRKQAEFGEVMRRGRARGCINVRNAQMKLVVAGNPAMGIWLGKNLLGQTGAPSIRMAIPKIRTAADYGVAADKVLQAVARGRISPAHGKDMMNIIAIHSSIVVNERLVIETGINQESTVPDFICVQFVGDDREVEDSFVIEVDKRVEPKRWVGGSKTLRARERQQPVQDYDSPQLLQKSIELNTKTHRQWVMARNKSSDEIVGGLDESVA